MILILGGTSDARELARILRDGGMESCLHTLTQFGSELASENGHAEFGEFDEAALRKELQDYRLVVDATHPFATRISTLAMRICETMGVPYLRYERPVVDLPEWVVKTHSHKEAAEKAAHLSQGKRILLTVGSRELKTYVQTFRATRVDFVARVLPTSASLLDCEEAGLSPAEILAMFGVPEMSMERAILKHFDAGVVVSKESGEAGGLVDKLKAAHLHGAAAVVVIRPAMSYPWMSHKLGDVAAEVRSRLAKR